MNILKRYRARRAIRPALTALVTLPGMISHDFSAHDRARVRGGTMNIIRRYQCWATARTLRRYRTKRYARALRYGMPDVLSGGER